MASKVSASSKEFPKGPLSGSQECPAAPRSSSCLHPENHGRPQLCAGRTAQPVISASLGS